jgi:triacylglycerol lipase
MVAGPDGAPDVRLLVFGQDARTDETGVGLPSILYIHGGGFVAGDPEMVSETCAALARETRSVVVAVDYRLAPETPFPGPLEDCFAALSWIHDHAHRLGIDTGRIALLGQSAGGGLAAALAQLTRDRGGPRVATQFLLYPMLDARTGTTDEPVHNPSVGQFLWTRSANRFGWDAMRGGQPVSGERLGHFSPSQATRFDDLPPAYIAVGSIDLFLDEDVAYAMNLSRAGVPVELHVYPGGLHGFDALPGPLASAFRRDLVNAIKIFAGKI